MYLTCTIRLLLKKNGMTFNSITTLKIDLLIYISPIKCALKKCQVLNVIKYIPFAPINLDIFFDY